MESLRDIVGKDLVLHNVDGGEYGSGSTDNEVTFHTYLYSIANSLMPVYSNRGGGGGGGVHAVIQQAGNANKGIEIASSAGRYLGT